MDDDGREERGSTPWVLADKRKDGRELLLLYQSPTGQGLDDSLEVVDVAEFDDKVIVRIVQRVR